MRKMMFVLVLVALLAACLSACSPSTDMQVSDGDIAACMALKGTDVSSWEFSTMQKMANNVCYVYQQQR